MVSTYCVPSFRRVKASLRPVKTGSSWGEREGGKEGGRAGEWCRQTQCIRLSREGGREGGREEEEGAYLHDEQHQLSNIALVLRQTQGKQTREGGREGRREGGRDGGREGRHVPAARTA